jgi:hypothetical protein
MSPSRPIVGTLAMLVALSLGGCGEPRTTAETRHQGLAEAGWIPGPARTTMLAQANGADLTRVEAVGDDQGGMLYQATFKRAGAERILTVSGDGRMVSDQVVSAPPAFSAPGGPGTHPVTLGALPELARATILKHVKAEDVKRIDQSGEGDRAIFDVVAEHEGVVIRLQVDAAGRLRGGSAATVTAAAGRGALEGMSDSARSRVLEQARGSGIADVHSAVREGRVVYDIRLDPRGFNGFQVDGDGRLLGKMRVEGGIEPGDVKVGRATFMRLANAGVIRQIERLADSGLELYVGLVEDQGRAQRLVVDREGRLVSSRQVVKTLVVYDLVGPALQAVTEHAGGRAIQRIEEQAEGTRVVYDVRLADEDAPLELQVDESGQLVQR